MFRKRLKDLRSQVALERPPSTGLQEGLQWLMMARLGLCYLALFVIIMQQVLGSQKIATPYLLLGYSLLAGSFVFTLLQGVWLDRLPMRWVVGAVNVVFDSLIISTWILLIGNFRSLFALLYLVQILFVSLIYFKRGALLASSLAATLFGLVCVIHSAESTFLVWGIYSLLFAILGFVGGYLSEELNLITQSLKEETRKVEKLQIFHQKIIESLPTGLLIINKDLGVNFINPAGEHILGKSAPELIGKKLKEVEPDLLPFFEKIEMQDIRDNTVMEEVESDTLLSVTGSHQRKSFFAHPKSDGKTRLQQSVELGKGVKTKIIRGDVTVFGADTPFGRMLRSQPGANVGVLLFQDVTKLRQLEDKLKQNEKMAAVGQLAAGIAHEIRNPLASMSASIEMLKRSLPSTGDQDENQKLMEIAIREIDRLNNLISEFLDFVKPTSFKVEKVSLEKLLSELVLAVRNSKLFESKVQFLEKYDASSSALGNSEKLKQVVWNLLVNAIDAIRDAGTVEIGCSVVNDHLVKFWVADQGEGMGEEVLSHLYEPFFTTKKKGTGLGLATAYKIIEAHHGEIRVESKVQKGTRFEIYLPSA